MIEFAINVVTGIVIAAVSAFITVRLSLNLFRSEKLWERKVAAYERVIEALHHSKAFTDAHLAGIYAGREVSEERNQDLRQRSSTAHLEIEKAADVGAFLLTAEAQARLKKYQKESRDAGNTPSWHQYLEDDLIATSSCLSDLIRIAKKDLGAT